MKKDIHQKIKSQRCLVCNSVQVDVAHIKTKGSGGFDEEWNLMPLCRIHHTEQHKIGIVTFAIKYYSVHEHLAENGWSIEQRKLRRSGTNY